MTAHRYRTITAEGTGKIREKASRFIAIAFPTRSAEAFKERLQEFMREHHGAKHFCHAWVLDDDGGRYRANDAGEPAGTAGKPILNRIRTMDLTWCGVIVVRYFGGTLLGKAGLVKAYGEAAQLALDDAPVVEHKVLVRVSIHCDHAHFEAVRNAVIVSGGEVEQGVFTERCMLVAALPNDLLDELLAGWEQQGIQVERQGSK